MLLVENHDGQTSSRISRSQPINKTWPRTFEFREFSPVKSTTLSPDYYQPEAYIASTGHLASKDSAINDEIDVSTSHSCTLTRLDYAASVSCIYGIGSPDHYVKCHSHRGSN